MLIYYLRRWKHIAREAQGAEHSLSSGLTIASGGRPSTLLRLLQEAGPRRSSASAFCRQELTACLAIKRLAACLKLPRMKNLYDIVDAIFAERQQFLTGSKYKIITTLSMLLKTKGQ